MSSTGSVPTISSLQFNAPNRKMEKTGSVLSKRIAEVETVLEEESSSSDDESGRLEMKAIPGSTSAGGSSEPPKKNWRE